jgi:pyrroloquinoline quinone (PQQ) biosynthesis protein C
MYKDSNPSFTLEESRAYIRQLGEEALTHRALNHPFLHALVEGTFNDPVVALKDFTFQYLAYSRDFMRFLTATIAQLDERPHREMLIHNLMEEAGKVDEDDVPALKQAGIDIAWIQGLPHPELYQRFLNAVNITPEFRAKTPFCDEALIWSKMFLNTCNSGGPAQALGAMGLGTENIVKHVYAQILQAIAKHLPVTPEQRVFFDLHAAVDDEHGEVIDEIAAHYAQFRRNREPLRTGMLMALNARAAFFDGMMARANRIRLVGEVLSDDLLKSA